MPLTRSGAIAAAMVAAPPDSECPAMTAGPPRYHHHPAPGRPSVNRDKQITEQEQERLRRLPLAMGPGR
ncbi:MAG: hypothetical protein ACM3ML_33205 [Micromonosporaceae bacterium]